MLKQHRTGIIVTIVLIIAILTLSWSHRPWQQSGVTTTKTEYTGTFGGHCDPQDNLVCLANSDKSVTVGDLSFLNGLKPHSVLPNKGTTVTVTVKEVMHRNKHGDTLKATVVSIKRSTE